LHNINELSGGVLQSYPQFQDFIVVHDYLVTPNQKQQARIRRRGQNGNLDNCRLMYYQGCTNYCVISGGSRSAKFQQLGVVFVVM